MLANYLKLALRTINRHRVTGAINLGGLALGLALCILIMLFVRDELTFDRFHDGHEAIYQVQRQYFEADGTPGSQGANGPLPLGELVATSVPGVAAYSRTRSVSLFVRRGRDVFEEEVLLVDPAFLSMFTFPLVEGDPATAMGPGRIVLSESAAARLLGTEARTGSTLEVRIGDTYRDFEVAGIAADPPSNSTLQFAVLVPIEAWIEAEYPDRRDAFQMSLVQTYVRTRPDQTREALQAGLDPLFARVLPDELERLRERTRYEPGVEPARYHAMPMAELHLTSASDPIYSVILSVLAAGILFIACINFMTTAIGRSLSRSTEVGVRKVVGARRSQLVGQFWGEAVLVVAVGTLIGLAVAWLALPWFNDLAGKRLVLDLASDWKIPAGILTLVVLTGCVAGSYPALVLSAFRPVDVLKSRVAASGANWFTRSLVTLQFALSVGLIIGALVMRQQTEYLTGRDKGFDTDQVVLVRLSGMDGPATARRFREALEGSPHVAGITTAASALGYRGTSGVRYDHEGKTYSVDFLSVDYNFLDEMGIPLSRGRGFDPNRSTDSSDAVIVNEALVRAFGFEDPIGERIPGLSDRFNGTIIGVTPDFEYQSLYQEVGPLMMAVRDFWGYDYMYARLAAGSAAAGLDELRGTWASVTSDIPFQFEFLDERMARVYASDLRWLRIINLAAIFAVVIAMLGLLGLTSIVVRGRVREIGIRKVLGASPTDLVGLVSREFLLLILIGSVIAMPLAWLGLDRWLSRFAFRVDVGPVVFAVATGMVLLAGLVVVTVQSMKAVVANPVESLRVE